MMSSQILVRLAGFGYGFDEMIDRVTRIRDFILTNTRQLRPPLVPEIVLHLAEESLPIWQKTEEELNEMNLPPPYWAFAWAGGQALARYILDNPATVAGRTVLDIGSGSGLVAIAARMAGARDVTANDIDAFALEACRINAAGNATEISVDGSNLIGDFQTTGTANLAPLIAAAEVLCLGDVFYEKELACHILDIAAHTYRRGGRILVGDPRRSYFPEDRFRKVDEYAVAVTRELEDNEIKNSAVWEYVGLLPSDPVRL
jgi:predicted nicotinamide N-methyase